MPDKLARAVCLCLCVCVSKRGSAWVFVFSRKIRNSPAVEKETVTFQVLGVYN
jgi:hypothetical protein